ncbi:MAG TPA: hypothetical protein VKD72_36185 [Gemmataceae bacterium]|nr:hypothetical protein [Gemmataceae bacterium]
MAKKPTATGSIPANFHEAGRSEYLAQYVFTMFGTSVLVPRQEDYGVDLYCTLFSEREGQRVWPVAYYSVQVKSELAPWEFNHPESVRWAVEYPAPLLYCIIQKKDGLVRLYQTMARFAAAVAAELPACMALVPGEPGSGRTYGFDGATGSHSLGPPILEFKVEDLLDDGRFEQYREVLRFWVLNDFDNVRRFQIGMRSVGWPGQHTTNEIPAGSNAKYSLAYAPPEIRAKAEETASELLEWLARVRLNDGDYLGALLAALMLRHREPDPRPGQFPWDLFSALRGFTGLEAATSTNGTDYVGAPFDKLLAELGERVLPKDPPAEATSGR